MSDWAALRATEAFRELTFTAARIGADPLEIQGPGGNVSLKDGGAMWVKASGTWLADALTTDIFVPVEAAAMREALRAGDASADRAQEFLATGESSSGLRPSIETSFHAAIPAPVVLHTHSVHVIAAAVRADAEAYLAKHLKGLGIGFVPYYKPGADLARAVMDVWEEDTRGVVLANHGVIASGETVAEAEALLAEVRKRLDVADVLSRSADPVLDAVLRNTGWKPLGPSATNALAFDTERLAKLAGGALYPDHVIFLGPGAFVAAVSEHAEDAVARAEAFLPPVGLVILPGAGAAVRRDATDATIALAELVGEVMLRIAPETPLNHLTPEEEHALLDWDAEKHRQALEAARTAKGAA